MLLFWVDFVVSLGFYWLRVLVVIVWMLILGCLILRFSFVLAVGNCLSCVADLLCFAGELVVCWFYFGGVAEVCCVICLYLFVCVF